MKIVIKKVPPMVYTLIITYIIYIYICMYYVYNYAIYLDLGDSLYT